MTWNTLKNTSHLPCHVPTGPCAHVRLVPPDVPSTAPADARSWACRSRPLRPRSPRWAWDEGVGRPWFYHGFTYWYVFFFTMVFTMMCVFFSDVLTCSTNFQILKGRVCAIYSILFADLLNEWGLWSSTSLYQGLDENCRWIRNHSPYIRPTFTSLLQQLQSTASYFSLSLSSKSLLSGG